MEEEKREDTLKKITLEELIDTTTKYYNGEFTDDDLNEYATTIQIRGYISLTEKIALIMNLMTTYQYSGYESQEIRVAELYRNIFFYVILGGYAFVDCSSIELVNFSNYDLLYPIFAPYILSYCQQDYDTFKSMLSDTINIYGIQDFVDAVDSIDMESMKEATRSNQMFITQLSENKDLVDKLNNILMANDPLTQTVVDELRKIGVEKARSGKSE